MTLESLLRGLTTEWTLAVMVGVANSFGAGGMRDGFLRRAVEKADAQHLTGAARETFRALARDRGIRLVLLDLYLPDGGPVSAFAADVRAAAPPACAIVVVSGDAANGPRVAAKIGARFVLKPAGADVLIDVMRESLTT